MTNLINDSDFTEVTNAAQLFNLAVNDEIDISIINNDLTHNGLIQIELFILAHPTITESPLKPSIIQYIDLLHECMDTADFEYVDAYHDAYKEYLLNLFFNIVLIEKKERFD